jgi:hypothetical protein
MAALQIADVSSQVPLSLFDDFEDTSVFKPRAFHRSAANAMLDELVGWGTALKRYREELRKASATGIAIGASLQANA